MHATHLKCPACGWTGPKAMTYACPKCGYSLDVAYDYDAVDRDEVAQVLRGHATVWSFRQLLPVCDEANIVSLNEGGTPLVPAIRIGKRMGVHLHMKDETRNPTLSFKDRPNSVGISVARELGCKTIAIASTGNGAASLSAYAARAGMPCNVVIPVSTPSGKLVQSLYHGANTIRVEGDYSASFRKAAALCAENGWANLTSTYVNPYTLEGDKTIAYEIYGSLGKVPDWIVVPLGAGPMLTGIYKGFVELKLLGLCDKLPRMLGVQACGCAPIIDAFLRGDDRVEPWLHTSTVADAIADPLTGYEMDGTRTARSIRTSGGYAVKLTDEAIMAAVAELARDEAMFVEPASAASVAAVDDAMQKGVVKQGETVVSIVTAHGLKDVAELLHAYEKQH